MTDRPKLLDLFCGAGGAAMGYYRAGFDVVGVDSKRQRNYPFYFVQDDALAFLDSLSSSGYSSQWGQFTAVHASPPCQRYSAMSNARPGLADGYPDLVACVRERLQKLGLPWVIENVPGSPLLDPVMLCGQMFGLDLYRHRLFESSFAVDVPEHPEHWKPASKAGHWKPGTVMSVAGHIAPIAMARQVMDIHWTTRAELAEAIPPAYSEFIGEQLIAHLSVAAVCEVVVAPLNQQEMI